MNPDARANWQHISTTARHLFWSADITMVMLILANAGLLWAFALLANTPFTHSPVFNLMFELAPAPAWALLFFLHSAGVYWTIFTRRPRQLWILTVNAYGLGIWLASTLAMNLSIQRFTPSTSLEIVVCLFGAWALYRTGIRKDIAR